MGLVRPDIPLAGLVGGADHPDLLAVLQPEPVEVGRVDEDSVLWQKGRQPGVRNGAALGLGDDPMGDQGKVVAVAVGIGFGSGVVLDRHVRGESGILLAGAGMNGLGGLLLIEVEQLAVGVRHSVTVVASA